MMYQSMRAARLADASRELIAARCGPNAECRNSLLPILAACRCAYGTSHGFMARPCKAHANGWAQYGDEF
jgi:hypothetical protein